MTADLEARHELAEELRTECERLDTENAVFESYLQRVGRSNAALGGADGNEDTNLSSRKLIASGGKKGGKTAGSKSGAQAAVKVRDLTAEERYDVVTSEMEIMAGSIDGVKTDGEKKLSELRALLEETDLRIAETKKDTYEFKRDIVVGAENIRTGKTSAEKMLRYLEGCAGAKDSVIEKLKLKNISLKTQISKLEQQLQQKEETGEVLHVIDFDQLKIENQQYLERIEERNNELLRLKLTTGKTVATLNLLKKKLGEISKRGEWLRKETAERRDMQATFDDALARVSDEHGGAAKQNKILNTESKDDDSPQVLEYINAKHKVVDLEKKIVDWERKLELAEMEFKRVHNTHTNINTSR
mmetsp:Transcript_2289/g.5449  ORF Transcript_2289/g.5449 Transcript_2289/m.5449 type:complete len:358 (-) Transcript_2289:229-1302(-)